MTTPTCTFVSGDVQKITRGTSAAAAITAGDILVNGNLTLVAHTNFAEGDVEELAYDGGVYDVVKAAGTDFTLGDRVYVDFSTGLAVKTPTATTRYFGLCAKTSITNATTVRSTHCQVASGQTFQSITAASTAVSNTASETAFDKTITIPANSVQVGDTLRITGQVIATATNSTDTLNIKLKIGSTVIVATGALDATNNDVAVFFADVTIRTVGASGTLVAFGMATIGPVSSATMKPFYLASTAIDTTADMTISATATWSAASSGDSCRLDGLTVTKLAA